MTTTLRRAGLRYLLRHPWQAGLALVAIALGVAVVVSVDLAIGSARRAFTLSAEAVAGRVTHRVIGGPAGLPDRLVRTLRVDVGVRTAAPVVEADLLLPDHPGWTLRLLGVDPFVEAAVRPHLGGLTPGAGGLLRPLLTRPGATLLAGPTAARLGIAPGDTLVVVAGGVRRRVTVHAMLSPDDELSREALAGLLVADIATAQELLGRTGRVDAIDLVLPEDAGTEVPGGAAAGTALDRVRAALPPGAELVRAGTRERSMERMIGAFDLNLRALSLLTLLFGAFLIYNSMTFSVVQRRELLGTVRALGVTRRELMRLLLGEAAVLGVLGTALGIALGIALAHGMIDLVGRTINDLYFVVDVRDVAVAPSGLVKGGALGVGATLAAALAPAWEATTATPRAALARSTLEARARAVARRAAVAGAALLPIGGIVLGVSDRSVAGSFAGVFVVFLGFALLTPAATAALMRLLRPGLGRAFGVLGAMAARGVSAALSRTGPAVAALMIGIAVSIGVGVMIDSFRRTVATWLETSLRADVYVSAAAPHTARNEPTLPPELVERLAAVPGVAGVATRRGVTVRSPAGPTRLLVLGGDARARAGYRFAAGDASAAWPSVEEGAVLISEPLAYRRALSVDDTLRLRTDRGEREFAVAGVFRDYGSDRGVALLDRTTYDRYWDDPGISALGIHAESGRDPSPLMTELRAAAGDGAELRVRSNRALRQASLRVFDRTFAITGVLRLLTLVVAFIAVLAALMALQIERAREIGLLRATGLTPGQLWRLITAETGLAGLAAGLIAMPVGIVLAFIMTHVINRRSFGWTIESHVDPGLLGQALLVGMAAALLAGLYPAFRMARTEPAAALREE